MRPEKLYLVDIVEAARSIEKFCAGVSREQFAEEDMRRGAVLQKLIVIGEAASRLPKDFTDRYADIPWLDVIAFRNIREMMLRT